MHSKVSTLRIIGGKWRSRRIDFLPLKGVRPTTNVNRETLFNWLSPIIVGANCLDLFAGSGALGFESLSRGAGHVVMVDMSNKIINQLKDNAELLQADNVEFYCAEVPRQLGKIPKQAFDIIFLDPPFNQGLIKPTCEKLLTSDFFAKNAYVYIESEKRLDIEAVVPKTWQILRQKTSGLAKSCLLRIE
jgi:16S rRNA (guanine966-N2)-methyltransferase